MYSRFIKICSMLLVMVMLFNLLPHEAIALDSTITEQSTMTNAEKLEDQEKTADESADIVAEIIEKRTEFSKEYKLSNGLHMAVVYPEAVHYDENGQWKDIDNTLKTVGTGSTGTFTNTAGAWEAEFPQRLNKNNQVSVTKDGYTVSFGMAGELRKEVVSAGNSSLFGMRISEGTAANAPLTVEQMQVSAAQIQELDYTAAKESAEHPEIIRDKLQSQLVYNDVYDNTDIIYDLNSYQLKESVEIEVFDPSVQGYRYTLETGTLVPVLKDDGSIDFITPSNDEIIMTMPAPYMIDATGATSMDVEVYLVPQETTYTLTYIMPMDWLADADRQWPVVLDPVIKAESEAKNILDHFVGDGGGENYKHGTMYCGYNSMYGKTRTFIQYVDLPGLSSADVIVNASLSLLRHGGTSNTTTVEAHKVNATWDSTTITWANQPTHNSTIEDYAQVGGNGRYYWEITDVAKGWYTGENTGIMLKAPATVENSTTENWKKFYSIDYDVTDPNTWPYLYITFRNSNGLEDYWDYTASSAGRAGTGYVNNYSGNLTWIHSNIGIGGNRMPVTINHIYNANDSSQNSFCLGYGWRTNFNQIVSIWSEDNTYYVWEDGDGTKHYFKNESAGVYKDEDGLELTLTVSGSNKTITDKYGNASHFDGLGRLVKLENNQVSQSNITITYMNATSKLIYRIADGAGRVYSFTYSGNLLRRISYIGYGSKEHSYVTFGYSGTNLTSITDKDGKTSSYTYSSNLLTTAQDIDGYKLQYSYSAGMPKRVVGISEYDGTTEGGSMTIEYAHNQTTFKDHNNNIQIKQFNDWGNVVSVQDGQGRAQYGEYAKKSDNDEAKANQLTLSSKMQNTVSNLFLNTSFEDSNSEWSLNSATITKTDSTESAYMGSKSMKLVGSTDSTRYGAFSRKYTVAPGETVTFSAYIKTVDTKVALAFERATNYRIFDGAVIGEGKNWNRYEMSYTNTSTGTEEFRCYFFVQDAGTVYVDCVQLERMPTASRYNLIQNGDFSNTTAWSNVSGRTTNIANAGVTTPAAPQLDTYFYKMVGNPTGTVMTSQTVKVSGAKDDCYVFSGWAKGDSAPLTYENRAFGMKLIFNNTDGTQTTVPVSFNTACDSDVNWQYAAAKAKAEKAYSSITVQLLYDHNVNTAWFDGIQLFKEEFGTIYTYDKDGNLISAVDYQKQKTEYEYTDNNLTKIIQAGNTQMTYTYDDHHNVKTATTGSGVVYRFEYDAYGNNTQVSIVSGDQEITTKARYSEDGNRLEYVLDTLDNKTKYCYNRDTNVLEWVEYPNDTETTRTEYTYDEMFRLATAAADVNTGYTLTASYTYTDDMLTAIETGSTTYGFTYGDFAQRTGVKVGNHTLATYTYTPDKNSYLSQLTYGNDDRIQYTYDKYGRVIKETYEDGAYVTYAYDNTGNLATVTDSETGIKFTYYYDLTNRLVKYTEEGNGYSHQITYTYDGKNNLVSTTESSNGRVNPLSYTYDANNRLTKLTYGAGGKTYTYDAYGRLTQRGSIYFANTNIRENITYKTFSTNGTTQIATWQNVSNTHNVTYSYTYDDNGNITAISDGTNTTSYVYDSANQLIRENNQAGGFTKTWTYDDAGNILSRGEYAYTTGALGTPNDTVTYTYGDADWGDKLTAYDGNTITYDGVGNPLNDGTWTYTWKHGRQLVSMTDGTTTVAYTYNADGMRIGKTVTRSNYSETHKYFYDNGNLTYDIITIVDNGVTTTHDLLMSYDESGRPMMITYDHVSYYYLLNAQGDVVAITSVTGVLQVAYTYDAWGNVLSITGPMADTMGQWNQLRYRGYVYDQETGLYYCNSRYYDPEIGRWISPEPNVFAGAYDSNSGFTGYNVYAYCANNPVIFSDSTGEFALGAILGKAAIGAAVNVLTTYIGAKVTGQSYSWKDAGVAALAGALGTGSTLFKVAAGVVSGLYTGVTAYQNGATLGKTVISGAVSAWGTTVSVANIAGWTGPALELGVSTFTDIVFGTASNSISAATYRASIETSKSNTTKQQVVKQRTNKYNRAKLYCV